MRLALSVNYSGAAMSLDTAQILESERLGYASVWSAEAYGSDAVVPAAWIAARTEKIHVGTATAVRTMAELVL
jgi:alkanesulfonate monooxygenase SsuD/methylene tetrahydromethanopterin reductase-like flavin-dependent oxidoreductase (luciferase family)